MNHCLKILSNSDYFRSLLKFKNDIMKRNLVLYSLVLIGMLSYGCKQQATTSEEPSESTTENSYSLTAFSPSQSFPDAEITSMKYENGVFNFGIGGETYELGVQTPDAPQKMCANSAEGQHIHLIDGTAPYAAKYTNEFEYDLEDGEHYLLAFLSRSYHESIKTTNASVAEKVMVQDKAITTANAITDPTLFYSRPKGTYVGKADTEKVMLDFYLVNCELGEDYSVKAEINGEEHMIDTWQPYYIEGMPMGDNTIKLTLLDSDGNVVDSPINPVERKFTLKADPAEE